MHDYLFDINTVRFAFVIGVLASVFVYERFHITSGSIVVPGYVAVFVLQPLILLVTLANALFSYWLVNHVLTKRLLLDGRNKFSTIMIISATVQVILLRISPSTPYLWESSIPLLVGVGYLVPALIAHDFGRQGIKPTMKAVGMSSALVAVPMTLAIMFFPDAQAGGNLAGFGVLAFAPEWIPFTVLLSAAAAWALQYNYGFRSAGYVGAAYLAMLTTSPLNLIFLGVIGVFAWVLVTRVFMRTMIVFGRRKFALMMVSASVVSWAGVWIAIAVFDISVTAYESMATVALTPLFVPGLIANDLERSSPLMVFSGLVYSVSFVLTTTWLVTTAVTGYYAGWVPLPMAIAVAVVTGLVIFGNQFVLLAKWAWASAMSRFRTPAPARG
ncbi:MAG: poly-gamma-glutamate biosynthesis protein PgsC/CapC [Actinomycetota bacterium]|nr:poly-gamma-glutamate biosynthesis protein PgsC/CapC [Actinomycetota bacterium]